jgi:protein-L-isoaspartate(D-aspartate) O-methyltransferase
MTDFVAARRTMVDGQVRTSDVTDLRIIAAMLEIPRERFVPELQAALAYLDRDIEVTPGKRGKGARCLLKPMVLAKLIQAADVRETDRVLDVGCATGYSSALIARLAASVVALEEDRALAQAAGQKLKSLGVLNVSVVTGPLNEGWRVGAPFDVIVLNGTAENIPRSLSGQLKEEGRLVAIEGRAPATRAMLYRRVGGEMSGWPVFDAGAPVLPGFAVPPAFVF